jgi:hypothetical protein
MTTNIRTRIRTGFAAAVLALGFLAAPAHAASVRTEPNGVIRFYDDNGYDRGYAWCLSGGGSSFGTPVCDFDTLQQCQSSGSPGRNCTPNPSSYYVRKIPAQHPRLQ